LKVEDPYVGEKGGKEAEGVGGWGMVNFKN